MTKRLESLTPEQKARMGSFAQEWIQHGWRTQPLTEEEWKVVEDGMRRCYEHAGIPWPGVVVRVPSPIVGAFAAPAAQFLITLHRKLNEKAKNAKDSGGAVDDAVDGAVDGAVYGAVDGAVRDAVDGAVDDAVRDAALKTISQLWNHRFGGHLWPNWRAYVAFFRDVVELQLDDDIWDRSRAYDDASSAGWWWPFRDFVMVCEPPVELHVERVGPDGWGSHRMHCETGPAVRWSDGWGVYSWHGTEVPAWVIEEPTMEKAMAESNTERRRAALESYGWGKAITEIGEEPISTCPDPGNAPHVLKLYSLPKKYNPYGQPVNLLVMTNGSPDRSGDLRIYGETVPVKVSTKGRDGKEYPPALCSAAWQYGVDPSVYAQIERRT